MIESRNVLREVFGFEPFRPGQEKVIDRLLDGRLALAVFQTGSGKETPGILEEDLALIDELRKKQFPALRYPRQLTRFLCGITSPAAIRQRLTRREEFGMHAAGRAVS